MNNYLQFQENWRRRVFFWSDFAWNDPFAKYHILNIWPSGSKKKTIKSMEMSGGIPFFSALPTVGPSWRVVGIYYITQKILNVFL